MVGIRAFWLKRFAAARALYAAILVVSLIAVGLLSSATAFLDMSSALGNRSMLAAAPPIGQSVRVRTATVPGVQQDILIAGVLGRAFGSGGYNSRETLRAPGLTVNGSSERQAIVESISSLSDNAQLVAGVWLTKTGATPGGLPVPAELQADAAAALDLAPGDTVAVGGPGASTTLLVVGTWRVKDPTDPLWFADPAVESGFDDTAVGPFVVSENDMGIFTTAGTKEWVATPAAKALTQDQIRQIADGTSAAAISDALDIAGSGSDASIEGRISETATRMLQADRGATALSTIPSVLLFFMAALCMSQLARLLGGARREETAVLRARGASWVQLVAVSGGEASAAVGLGSVGGYAGGRFLLGAVAASLGSNRAADTPKISASAAELSIAVASGVGLALALVVVVQLAFDYDRSAVALHGRRNVDVRFVSAVGTGLLSVLSVWQLLSVGGQTSHGRGLNPVAAIAPVLVLVAVALTLSFLVPLISRIAAVALEPGGPLPVLLAARALARRQGPFAAIVLVVALSVGGTVLTGALSDTWRGVDEDTRTSINGPDARISIDASNIGTSTSPGISARPYSQLAGVTSASPVLSLSPAVGKDTVALLGLTAGTIPGIEPPTQLGDEGVVVDDASSLAVTVDSGGRGIGRAGTITVTAWFCDSLGGLTSRSLGEVTVDHVARGAAVTTTLPPGVGAIRLLALDLRLEGSPGAALSVRISDVETLDDASTMKPFNLGAMSAPATLSSATPLARTAIGTTEPGTRALPVVLSNALMERQGLRPGATFDLALPSGRTIAAVVKGGVPKVPGAGSSWVVVADLPTLDRALLSAGGSIVGPNEVWARTTDPQQMAADALALSPYQTTVTTAATYSTEPVLTPTVTLLWAAVCGTLVIALISFASSTLVLLRSRRDEVHVLHALGLALRSHGYLRGGEIAFLLLFAFIAGTLAGLVAALFSAVTLARIATPNAADGHLVAAGSEYALVLIGGFATGLVTVAVRYGVLVRRQATE